MSTMSTSSEVLSLKFNQNFGKICINKLIIISNNYYMTFDIFKGCFIVGMNDGLRIFNTEPLVEKLYLSMLI